jgi:TrpR-related protein YerC/YecD
MGKPKFEVDDKDYHKDIHFLYQILGKLKNLEEVKLFFKDILTSSELRMLKRRWHIACLLDEGWDLREVAKRSKTSTSTAIKVKRLIEEGSGGLKLALEKTKNQRVAKEPELKPRVGTLSGGFNRWIFGKGRG